MKKKLSLFLISVLTLVLMIGGTLSTSVASAQVGRTGVPAPLQFQENGKFKILQIADVQDYGKTNRDAIRVIEAALDKVEPDLVVFTGDQVEGYASYFWVNATAKKHVKETIDNILVPINDRNIPFAIVFGNHDDESGVSKEEQMKMYQSYRNCLAVDDEPSLFGCGTYNLPVLSSDSSKTAFNIYMVDSNAYAEKGGYDTVHQDQIDYCKKIASQLKSDNGGTTVPSLLFQHIPVQEMYQLLKEVPEGTDGSIKWYRDLHPGAFALSDTNRVGEKTDNFFLRESIACADTNAGQFNAWLESGDVIGAYFAHDHINNFVGNYKGIDLGYGLGTSYNAYGAGLDGGVRVFTIDEKDPTAYTTTTLSYRELCGEKMLQPVASFFSAKLSISATEIAVFASIAVACLLVLVLTVAAIVVKVKKTKHSKKETVASVQS